MPKYIGKTPEARAKQLANLKMGVKGVRPPSPNIGRKPKTIRAFNEEMKALGYEPMSKEDITGMYLNICLMEEEMLQKIIKDKSEPMIKRIVAKNVLGGKGFDIIERMLDRAIGKSGQSVDLTSGGKEIKVEPLRVEVIDSRDKVQVKTEE